MLKKIHQLLLIAVRLKKYTDFIEKIRRKACLLMSVANIKINPKDRLEISAHKGFI